VDENNTACLHQEEDVHVLAGALKLFFREMKSPLISYNLFTKCIEACREFCNFLIFVVHF